MVLVPHDLNTLAGTVRTVLVPHDRNILFWLRSIISTTSDA